MKKRVLLILVYTVVVGALVASVRHERDVAHQTSHEVFVADCGDPPPTPSAGE